MQIESVLCCDGSGQVKFDYALFERDYFCPEGNTYAIP
jgi:hypothetical protein